MTSVSIIGAGRLGGALAVALTRAKVPLSTIVFRDPNIRSALQFSVDPKAAWVAAGEDRPIDGTVVLITVADSDIGGVVEDLRNADICSSVILHTSGALSSDVLGPLRAHDRAIGSLHPLISVSDPEAGASAFEGAFFCIEGDDQARSAAIELCGKLGGQYFEIQPDLKPLYHAAAVMASGHLTALLDASIAVLQQCGLEPRAARAILMPLVRSTVENIAEQGTLDALTGSFARLDAATVESHLNMLDEKLTGGEQAIYRLLGERSLEITEKRGADPGKIKRIRQLINDRAPKCV